MISRFCCPSYALFLEEDAPPDVYEKAPNRALNTPPSSVTKITEFETTEAEKTIKSEERRIEFDDLQQDNSKCTCPVVACRAVHAGEEELVEHFQVHKQNTSTRNFRRKSVRSLCHTEPTTARSCRLLRAAAKQLGHMLSMLSGTRQIIEHQDNALRA